MAMAFWRDAILAIRSVRVRPASSAVIVLTLALAIAASAVVFAVAKNILLTPLPFGDPDRLVAVAEADAHVTHADGISVSAAREIRARSHSLLRLSLFADSGVRPIIDGRVVELRGLRVSADFFDTLEVPLYLGRGFPLDEDAPGRGHVLVLSYGAWHELFGADPAIVGRPISTIDGNYVVAGILPADFHPLHMSNPAELPRVFIPLGERADEQCWSGACRRWRAVGRLAPGISLADARGELAATFASVTHEHASDYPPTAALSVMPLKAEVLGQFGTAIYLLEAAVILLLLLAYANAATMLLARAIPRHAEMILRTALGARRGQLMRQLLVETATLAGMASAIGIAIAWVAIRWIAQTGTSNIPRIGELAPDATMLLFAAGAALLTSVATGLVPAVVASRGTMTTLRSAPTASGQQTHQRLVKLLVGGEMALAFVLVLSMALLGRSYSKILSVNPGFNPENVLTLSLLPDGVHYPAQEQRLAYFEAVVARMLRIPGVTAAGYASTLPLSHPSTAQVYVRENRLARKADAPSLDVYLVSANFLDVMRIPVRRGRGFAPADRASTERVALVSESAGQRLFGDTDAIGQHIQIDSDDGGWAVIVGVVGDVHQYGLDRPGDAAVYVPSSQVIEGQGWASLVIRASVPPGRIVSAARQAMIDVDPLQPIFHVQPMDTYLALSVAQRTFTLGLLGVFGLIATILAIGGVYGVVSYAVERRTREIGVRLALGATPSRVRRMIAAEMLSVAAAGIVAGLSASLILTRSLSSLLFGVSRLDAPTIGSVLFVLLGAAWVASYVPALRLTRIAPADALRRE